MPTYYRRRSYTKRPYRRANAPTRRYRRRSAKPRLGLKYRTNRGYTAVRRSFRGKALHHSNKAFNWLTRKIPNTLWNVGTKAVLYKIKHPNSDWYGY